MSVFDPMPRNVPADSQAYTDWYARELARVKASRQRRAEAVRARKAEAAAAAQAATAEPVAPPSPEATGEPTPAAPAVEAKPETNKYMARIAELRHEGKLIIEAATQAAREFPEDYRRMRGE
ncbi:MAG: hypothetical protein H3C30_05325 [Candidatus Hydrogenedentes bacterium]|nr:hypothetical protein [Candidatus Hydrogenedentota bacterium]